MAENDDDTVGTIPVVAVPVKPEPINVAASMAEFGDKIAEAWGPAFTK